jgi:hypothetical protein
LRRSLLVAAVILTTTVVLVPDISNAQDVVLRPAELRSGSCASIGESVTPLEDVVAPGGDEASLAGATPVEQSVTVVPQLLPDLLSGELIVVVGKSTDEPGTLAACGVVGGVAAEDGTLAVGINPMEGSRLDGVAYFAPKRDDSGTTVTLLLVDSRTSEAASGPAGPVGMAGEDGTITLGGVSENTGGVTVVEDGSGSAPPVTTANAPAPAPAGSIEDAASADGKGNRDGKDGNGGKGNAGNDGAASAAG